MTDDARPDDVTRTHGGADDPPRRATKLPERIGDYRILGVLGEGGMGVVYEAEQASPRRKVAIKVVSGGQFVDEARVRMFEREAATLARLKHADIGAIYESGRTEDGQHFFAMELVLGETLDRYLAKRPQPDTADEVRFRLALLRKITDAVQYAHQRGVIHRDLKPANIVITEEAAAESSQAETRTSLSGYGLPGVKILDFGLARITDGDIAAATMTTEIGVIKGTLPYMSPEQAKGDPADIDVRTDVYALGVMLYEMLCGNRPYDLERRALVEAVRVICEERPRPLRQVSANARAIDVDVETIVGKALEKDAPRRYGSAAELSSDIHRFLTSQPIQARPPNAMYQLKKLVSRNRVPAALVGALLAMLVVFAGGISVLYVRAQQAEAEASRQAETATRALEFMTGMFEVSDPGESRGNTITAREVLDEGARRIDVELVDQPVVQAALMGAMGRVYYNLGLLDDSEPLLARAVARRAEVLGDDDLDTLASTGALAQLYEDTGRLDEAERLLTDVIARAERVDGPSGRTTISARGQLSGVYDQQGKVDEALALIEETVRQASEHLGPDDPDTLAARNDLGWMYVEAGRLEEGLEILTGVEAIQHERRGPDHPETMRAINNVAWAYQAHGRYDEAEARFLEVIESLARVLGPDHYETLVSRSNLAVNLVEEGRYDEAEAIVDDILAVQLRTFGPDHTSVLMSKRNQVVIYQKQGRFDEAGALSDAIVADYVRVFGADHPDTLSAMGNAAINFMFVGDLDEAERRYRTLVERSTAVLGADHPQTVIQIENLANVRYQQGDLDEAERLVRQVMEARGRVLGVDHPATLRTRGNLAVVLQNKGDLARARVLLEEAVAIQREALGDEHPDVADALENLARNHVKAGEPDDAARIQREVVALRRALHGEGSAEEADSLMVFAYMMATFERWAEIEELTRQAATIRERIPGLDEAGVLEARHIRASTIVNQGRFEEAESLALQCYEDAVRLGETGRATHLAGKLVQVYEGLGNDAEAAVWGARAKPAP